MNLKSLIFNYNGKFTEQKKSIAMVVKGTCYYKYGRLQLPVFYMVVNFEQQKVTKIRMIMIWAGIYKSSRTLNLLIFNLYKLI